MGTVSLVISAFQQVVVLMLPKRIAAGFRKKKPRSGCSDANGLF
jgi:hypothetical protein